MSSGSKAIWHFIGKTATFFLAIFLACEIPPVFGDPYLRVCKNGVIYYFFSDRGRGTAEQLPVPVLRTGTGRRQQGYKLAPRQVDPLVKEVSRYYDLPPSLVKAIIRVESNFNPGATSPKGAQGLMQLMPGTAEQLAVVDPYDMRENVWAGTRYLRQLLDRFNNRLPLALAAYNAGPRRVEKHQDIPPIKETRGFVRDVCINFLKYAAE